MNIEKPYIPSKAEMEKAEKMAAETEINISIKQAFKKWQPKNEELKKIIDQGDEHHDTYLETVKGANLERIYKGEKTRVIKDFKSLEVEEIKLPSTEDMTASKNRAIKILPKGLILEKSEPYEYKDQVRINVEKEVKFRENLEYYIKTAEEALKKIKNDLELLKSAKDKLDIVFGKLKIKK